MTDYFIFESMIIVFTVGNRSNCFQIGDKKRLVHLVSIIAFAIAATPCDIALPEERRVRTYVVSITDKEPYPRCYTDFFMPTRLSMTFIMLINIKMPTTVGILTFVSVMNTKSESLRARRVFIFQQINFYEQLKFMLSWVEH